MLLYLKTFFYILTFIGISIDISRIGTIEKKRFISEKILGLGRGVRTWPIGATPGYYNMTKYEAVLQNRM